MSGPVESRNQRAESIKERFSLEIYKNVVFVTNLLEVSRVRHTVENKQKEGLNLAGWKRPRLGMCSN